MSESSSFKTVAMGQEAARKFDYFITALTGAVFSYLINHLSPEKLGWNYFTVNLVSLTLLVVSFYLGFRRIEKHHIMLFVNGSILEYSEKSGSMMKLMAEGKSGYNESSGEVYSVHQAETLYNRYQKKVQLLESHLDEVTDKSSSLYKWRNRFLAFGFCLLIASKILQPYFP